MAKKSLGQNFLVDQHAIAEILGAVPANADTILEIGPGKGALTLQLAKMCKKLLLLEKDEEVLAGTRTRLKIDKVEDFHAWEGDALEFDFEKIWSEGYAKGDIVVVSNLPYNVATEILFRLLKCSERISNMVLMFQEEVARRICAKSSTKAYGAISVLVQNIFEIEHVIKLSPESFRPRPKIDSGVLRFTRRPKPRLPLPADEYDTFSDFIHICFRQRRKTLVNALHHNMGELPIRNKCDKTELSNKLGSLGINETRRAETLELEDFFKLFQLLKM